MGLENMDVEKITGRPLEFIWLLDVSGSMSGEKINSLNTAIRNVLPEMRTVAQENPQADVRMRAITFGNSVNWHIETSTPVDKVTWKDVDADGMTRMGGAFEAVAKALDVSNMPSRGLPPVLVLLSDGMPNDDWEKGLDILFAQSWAKKAVRIAIAIGRDADEDVLSKFIGNNEIAVLKASNATQLIQYIKYASTEVLKSASASSSMIDAGGQPTSGVVLPAPPDPADVTNSVW